MTELKTTLTLQEAYYIWEVEITSRFNEWWASEQQRRKP